ncbi:protein FAM222B [Callorhinchus milii]|uniref:protein FAM222B n=1 Tax=Callorhinchus milii TaxID=7868 RepID=UPI0004574587|nr:protein FAM222B [Callorhinchus milii]XP_042194344.1 protein FAM222B [Callorhinchus milii]|eukprot:gi/632957880/ref/XP_007894727.1/ PREDICTED: protein FAM222B [Callorhinchus milii]
MLACLRRPGDLSLQLLSHTQMNTGLQKWENTQKMRSAQHPTPAELDAYAKKVANNPLTIKIFPNSVKVPQRKHLRRTVNGLDTSGQRFSPYPTQASSNRGLLAIVKLPTKRIVKDFDGSRARLLPEVAMNPPSSALYAAPSTLSHPQSNPLLQPGLHGYRKMRPDADAPPNVTVSTSTIPLSMAANPQQSRPSDLNSIVHQIYQMCQASASLTTTSVCEGQIANPSPISRNVLIHASSRVSGHSVQVPLPTCIVNPGDPTAAMAAIASGGLAMGNINRMPVGYHNDVDPATWHQHQLAQLQHLTRDAAIAGLPNKLPREVPGSGFTSKTLNYPAELCLGQPFTLKPPGDKLSPSPPINGMQGGLAYSNGQYFQPVWNNILPTPNSDSSGSQDLGMVFHGGPSVQVDCIAGTHFRAGSSGQTNMLQTMDYLGGDYQNSCFRDQTMGMMGKVHRPPISRGPEPNVNQNSHIHHPVYR